MAFSGGVDSLLVLHATVESLGKERVKVIIGIAPTLPERDLKLARYLAEKNGVELEEIKTDVMTVPEFVANGKDRCYHCRKKLNSMLTQMAPDGWVVVDGISASDLTDYRPGLTASEEAGIKHPLLEAGFVKEDIRTALQWLGYPKSIYLRPASPCLSSRIPYGERITMEKLKRIEMGEEFLKKLNFRVLRVRHHEIHNLPSAVVEIGENERVSLTPERMKEIAEGLNKIGFSRVYLDLMGFRSGSLNDILKSQEVK